MLSLRMSGGKQIDDLLNGFVGAVICGLQFTVLLVTGDRAVVEAAVGERTAEPFVEEESSPWVEPRPCWSERARVSPFVKMTLDFRCRDGDAPVVQTEVFPGSAGKLWPALVAGFGFFRGSRTAFPWSDSYRAGSVML